MPIVEECCCGCSLKTGSILIGVFYLLGSIVQSGILANDLYFTSEDQNWTPWVTAHELKLQGSLGCGIIEAILAIFLIVVAALEKAVLVLSWTILKIPMIIADSVIGIILFTAYYELDAKLTFAIILIFLVIASMCSTTLHMYAPAALRDNLKKAGDKILQAVMKWYLTPNFSVGKPKSVVEMAVIAQCCCGFSLKKGTIIIAILYMSGSIVQIATTAYRSDTLHHNDTAVGTNDRFFHDINKDSGHSKEDYSMNAWYKMLTPEAVSTTRALLIVGLVVAIVQAISGALLLYGAIQEIPEILFPWVVVETLLIIASAVIDIVTFIAVIMPDTVAGSIAGIFFSVLYVVFGVHFLRIVYDYYQILRERPKFYLPGKETDETEITKV